MRYLSKFFFLIGIVSIEVAVSAANAADSELITFDDVRLSIIKGNLGVALQQMKTGANSQNLDELQVNILQGLFFNALGKPKEALDSFRALGEAKSALPPIAYVGLAESLLLIGQKDQALINIKKALLLEPDSISARLLEVEISKDDYSEEYIVLSYQNLQQASNYSEQVDVTFARYLSAIVGARALELIAPMLERRTGNARLYEFWAQAQFKAGMSNEAIEAFTAAAQFYQRDGDSYNAQRLSDWLDAFTQKSEAVAKPKIESNDDNAAIAEQEKHFAHQSPDVGAAEEIDTEEEFEESVVSVKKPIEQKAGPIRESAKAEELSAADKIVPSLSPQAVPDPIVIASGSKVSTGSGFITNDGKWVITNRHVVENWKAVQVRNGLGERREAKEITYDQYLDLAIIELSEPYQKKLAHNLSDIVQPKVGESVFVIGFPLAQIFGNQYPVISMGIVSSNYGYMESDSQFQVTAKMNPGNSGGPVFNKKGQVIGVAVAKLDKKAVEKSSGKMPEDVNFALKGQNILNLANYQLSDETSQASATLDAEEIYARKRPSVVVVVTETD